MNEHRSFYNYEVYEDGRIYSNVRKKFLRGEITRFGYVQYVLFINRNPVRYRAHQLVALCFLQKPNTNERLIINHKDGNKLNNHFSNLEWCTYYENNKHARETGLNNISESNSIRWQNEEFRKRTGRNISNGIIRNESQKGKNNANFRYLISDKNGREYSREELKSLLGLSLSYTDVLIRRAAQGIAVDKLLEKGITITDLKSKV